MTFLNPAILFGLLAASIPVVLHFLNMRKLKKIEFSTLTFLKELQKTKIKRIKLKQWLLLLIRILIIILLVLAFARPAIRESAPGLSTSNTSAVIIIDNTFSMSVVTNDGSYFNLSKQTAKNILNLLQQGDEAAIVPVAQNENKISFLSSDLFNTNRIIDELNISYSSGTLHEAITKAGQILFESKNVNKEIYLLTDLQKDRIYNSVNDLSDFSKVLQGVSLFLVNINDLKANNIGIDDFAINNQILELNKSVSFSAKVSNYSENSINNSVASLLLNGKRNAQQSFSLNNGESKTLVFETTLNDTGLIEASVELEDDDIVYDNKRFLSFYVPDKINLLILTGVREDADFVKLAFSNSDRQLFNITGTHLSQLASININKYDAVIIISSENQNGLDNLKNFIESGGGVIIFPGTKSTIASLQKLFTYLEIGNPEIFIGNNNSTEVITRFEKIDFQHPIFSDLFDDKTKNQIESPDIYHYVKINPGSSGKTIISMPDNSAFLSEYKFGSGKVLVFNSAPVLSRNNFMLKSLFAPLLNKAVFYVSSNLNENNSYTTGEELAVDIRGVLSKQIKIVRPDNSFEFVSTDSLINKNYLNYDKSDHSGVYKFYSGNRLVGYPYVNHSPKESVIKYEDVSAFEEYLKKINYYESITILDYDEDISKSIYEARLGAELWKYFLILALLFALIEMLISKSSKKDIDEIKN